jgi:hypothetical protein
MKNDKNKSQKQLKIKMKNLNEICMVRNIGTGSNNLNADAKIDILNSKRLYVL